MSDSMSSYRLTRKAVRTGSIRWPNLRTGLIRATDIWLGRLEGMLLRDRLMLERTTWVEFHEFVCIFEPHEFRWQTGKRMTVNALDTVFRLQEQYLGLGLGLDLPDGMTNGAGDHANTASDEEGVVMVVDAEPDQD